ncbi:MAG: Crp/Fnr family transcriptional regulator [Gammaproteobacteria bacterium]|nr:Crp/Fnr family transcriptional regulator [Gammaproteobacteria bacterium]MCB1736592.1 Crp/Fnr family transcriptional regulator [Gammaproteobacteria bacterium]MCP5135512.1 Crp/Fnr family transcriptional regulator [Gammaproteobacteria bacterium]
MLSIYKSLSTADRKTLLDFADFLATRDRPEQAAGHAVAEPAHEPRPEKESVVQAIKRLSRIYHMVDRATLLNETSSLMSQHLMQGRAAVEVIDELETLFEKRYHALIGKTVGEE